jgi:hypothetical protein
MADMRDVYAVLLKESLDYILEDIEDAKLFEMVSIIARIAEQSAYNRRERKLQEECKAEQERYRNMPIPPPSQQIGMTGAQIGMMQHG